MLGVRKDVHRRNMAFFEGRSKRHLADANYSTAQQTPWAKRVCEQGDSLMVEVLEVERGKQNRKVMEAVYNQSQKLEVNVQTELVASIRHIGNIL